MTDTSSEKLDQSRISLFVLGFPKCGTTSLVDWFGQSGEIEVSSPKETSYFCPEFGRPAINDIQSAFSRSHDTLRLEGSTLNVYSKTLRAAMERNPHVKAVIIFREPWDAVLSWHMQMKKANLLSEEPFDTLFAGITDAPNDPQYLRNYRGMAAFGTHMSSWVNLIGHNRLFVIHLNELQNMNPELRRLLSGFANINPIESDVAKLNEYSTIKWKRLFFFLKNVWLARALFHALGRNQAIKRPMLKLKERIFLKRVEKVVASDELKEMLREEYTLACHILAENREFHRGFHER